MPNVTPEKYLSVGEYREILGVFQGVAGLLPFSTLPECSVGRGYHQDPQLHRSNEHDMRISVQSLGQR